MQEVAEYRLHGKSLPLDKRTAGKLKSESNELVDKALHSHQGSSYSPAQRRAKIQSFKVTNKKLPGKVTRGDWSKGRKDSNHPKDIKDNRDIINWDKDHKDRKASL